MTTKMPSKLRKKLQKQGYHLLGERGAFKACQWQQKSLVNEQDICYKQKFYGIESHRCLQMTPVVDKCTQNCEFCWRVVPADLGISWNQTTVSNEDVLNPRTLLDETLMANIRSLGGYNPEAGAKVKQERYLEAREPKHIAISLAGEPTLYPYLSEFIEEIHSRGMTSFLVTNGTMPEVIERITKPTQLYVTLAAPDERVHGHLLHPMIKHAWQRLLQTQELLHSFTCRRTNRLTMVAKKNMHDPRSYADLILLGEPDFVEVKGYMYIGASRGRLKRNNSPTHRDIQAFSEKLAALTGYYITDEQIESRVVLLSQKKKIRRIN